MPTYEPNEEFLRDYDGLTLEQQRQFQTAIAKFVEDLRRGEFRRGLRVKPMKGVSGIFEMTWEGEDGRATFEYGESLTADEPHIIWRRIGTHSIFDNP